jgi:cell division protein FtsN
LGVFSSQANAELMLGKAKAAGFKASSVKIGGQYKVRIGPIVERAQALDYQTKLKSSGLNNVLVEP